MLTCRCQLHARAPLCALALLTCAHMYDMEYYAHELLRIMVITVTVVQGTSLAAVVTQASYHRRAMLSGSNSNMCALVRDAIPTYQIKRITCPRNCKVQLRSEYAV